MTGEMEQPSPPFSFDLRRNTMFPDLTRDDVFRLETRSLWLRWPRIADAAAIARQAGEKAVAEMTANIPHTYPPQCHRRASDAGHDAEGPPE
jgi:hypothetical protein